MASFDIAVNKLLKWEGGYQSNTSDSGNYDKYGNLVGTNYGVTAKTLDALYGMAISMDGMKSMQKDFAKNVYYDGFWIPYKINQVENQEIANIVLDTFVIFSYTTAVSLVKKAINTTLRTTYTSIAPGQLNEISQKGKTSSFINNLVNERIAYHQYRVSIKPSQQVFLSGWTNRAESFRVTVVKKYFPYVLGLGGLAFLYFYYDRKKRK